jgi:cephalosporin-C deacetylase-like acetyl esterase
LEKLTGMKPVLVVALTAIIGFAAACKKDDALKGIDKQALFAPATSTEIADVQTLWAQRNLIPTDVAIEEAHSITDQLSVSVISFRVSNIKEYAAVLAPTAGRPLPIMFYVGGFSAEQSPVSSLQIKLKAADSLPFIYVVPALRGQSVSLQVNETTYNSPLSEGSRFDAFDGATDDVIAALNAVGMLFANADTATAMIRGGSRGGTVALLAGERDQRF